MLTRRRIGFDHLASFQAINSGSSGGFPTVIEIKKALLLVDKDKDRVRRFGLFPGNEQG